MNRTTSGNFRLFILLLAVFAMVGLHADAAIAQDESVKPGINAPFENADVDRFRGIFESESRVIYRYRHAIVAILDLKQGMNVADVGAGTGLFTRLLSPEIGSDGKVFAVDISQNFLDDIDTSAKAAGHDNVVTVLCDHKSINLTPSSVDLVFVCDTYHHFEFPQQTLASILRALKPDGRLVVVDFERIKGVTRPWVLGHVRCGKGTVTDEINDSGFEMTAEIPLMEEQYVLVFKKRRPMQTSQENGTK